MADRTQERAIVRRALLQGGAIALLAGAARAALPDPARPGDPKLSHAASAHDRLAHENARAKPGRTETAPDLPLVVLDPGHGGRDPGAIGVSGTYEKHVAFAAANELMRQLQADRRVRVALTRGRDVFIPLEDRVGWAQRRGAALFVSMHADAVSDPTVRGASIYTLSDTASDSQSAALARRENESDRFAGPAFRDQPPEVARILASLVRQETRSGSARLQRSMVGALDRDLPMLQNPARHAAFVVLKAADIPSILVEMGFMSNPQDEAALRQTEHRARVATAMKRAVDSFFAGPAIRVAG